MVGIGGFEPPTSRLSGVRSNHLSYTPTHMRRNNGCSLKTNQRGGLPCSARAALHDLPKCLANIARLSTWSACIRLSPNAGSP